MNEEMRSQTCVDCHAQSPPTNTNYTLISREHRWRLSRRVEADGSFVVEWRCPECWERHKARSADPASGPRAKLNDETLLGPASRRRKPG